MYCVVCRGSSDKADGSTREDTSSLIPGGCGCAAQVAWGHRAGLAVREDPYWQLENHEQEA